MNMTLAALFRTLAMGPGEIGFDLDLAPATLSLHQAIPCGLIVNELVSNSGAWKWVRAQARHPRRHVHSRTSARSRERAVRADSRGMLLM